VLILDTCHSGAAVGAGGSRDPFASHATVERLGREQVKMSVEGDSFAILPLGP
jgi:hypothetical protein